MGVDAKGRWQSARVPTADTAMLLALAAAKQASSPTSMVQARLGVPAARSSGGLPPRIALFAAPSKSAVRGSFDPAAAAAIGRGGER